MTQNDSALFWQKRGYSELKAAKVLFEKSDPELYGEVIFHCHLAVELMLKARYIREHDAAAPFTHNLGELAETLGEQWSESEREDFDQLSDTAVLARYGAEEWYADHATKGHASMWIEKVERIFSKIPL
jgi:HEPN domain-containing protein